MKTTIVCVVVCAFFSVLSAQGASRGGVVMSDLTSVVVIGSSVDAVTQAETVDLLDTSSGAVKGRDGLSKLTLNLADESDNRIHQVLQLGGTFRIAFDANGNVARLQWTNANSNSGPYAPPKPPVTRAQLQISNLDDVGIDTVSLDVGARTATLALRQQPVACRANKWTPIEKAHRCPSTGEPAMALALDLSCSADQKSFELLLHDATQFGSLSLGFDGKGTLSTLQFLPYSINVIPGGC